MKEEGTPGPEGHPVGTGPSRGTRTVACRKYLLLPELLGRNSQPIEREFRGSTETK